MVTIMEHQGPEKTYPIKSFDMVVRDFEQVIG